MQDKTTEIKEYAFMGCKHLHSIVLNEGLKLIKNHAFDDCSFTSIEIPASVEDIADLPFKKCENRYGHLYKVSIKIENNTHYFIDDKAIYKNIENGYKLISCSSGKKTVEVKEGTLIIGERAFSLCDKMTKVILPNTVKKIESYAFDNCYRLESVSFGEGPIEFEKNAFYRCENLDKSITQED